MNGTRAAAGIACAALALAAAGCGGSSAPKAGGGTSGGGGGGDGLAYAACMRSHGVPGFPDPARKGTFAFRVTPAMHIDPGSTTFQSANRACQALYPPPAPPTAQQSQARIQDVLSLVRCIRSHGFPSFPDPTSQGSMTSEMLSGAGIDVHSPSVQRALTACLPAAHGAITAADLRRFLAEH